MWMKRQRPLMRSTAITRCIPMPLAKLRWNAWTFERSLEACLIRFRHEQRDGRLRIIVLGYIIRCPLGGLAWHHLQYVLGLARLGHDVYFLEHSGDSDWSCYDPSTGLNGRDARYGLR